MSNYCIVTESTADLSVELIERFEITVIPMRFRVGDNDYLNYPDNRELSPKAFYNMLREGKTSTTSAVNIADFEDCFTPILESGKDILYLAFSSALSSTYNTGCIVAENLKEKYPERKIVVVDTLAAAHGEGLLVCKAAKLRQQGMGIDELAKWVEEHKLNIALWFTVDDLMHLYRGGRVSVVSAHIGTALGIKPLLHADDGGYLKPMNKVRGKKAALEALVKKMDELKCDMTKEMVMISHGDCLADAEHLAKMVKDKFSPEEIIIGDVGPVIGSHTGPGVVTLFFFAKGR